MSPDRESLAAPVAEPADPAAADSAPAGPPSDAAAGASAGEWVTARPTRAREVLARLVRLPALVREYRDLVTTTLRRDLSARFQGTLLGWAWPLVQPLVLFAVYYFIFTELLNIKMPGLPPEQKAAMGVYMFCGMIAWGAVGESLSRGTTVIVDNGNLIKKLAFPSELLPLNVVLAALVMALFAAGMFLVAAVATPVWTMPGPELLWIPAIVLVQLVFTYGLVLLLSTLQVFLRDTSQFVAMGTTVWMFLTPIFWLPEIMGESVERWMPFIRANPAYHMVAAWRGALMGDVSFSIERMTENGAKIVDVYHPVTVADVPAHLATFALWALGVYAAGYAFFVLSQRRFADEV